ncbi:BlaI/MecI/CopY family transcriptional regulator [Streptomyces longwoodensis]|uniref:BlaI/MecI/CopY family transcriptional regulator n=1 Tax=Streptomyces longwoodensis TaxID=68231 RepID=UPI0030DE27B3
MSENTTATTRLASQYASQVTTDLERNVEEQARLNAEIAALQEQLTTLQHDHTVLVNLQQALGLAPSAPAGPTTTPTVPAPRKKAAGSAKSTKSPASKAASSTATKATRVTKAVKPPVSTASAASTASTASTASADKSAKSAAPAAGKAAKATKSPASAASTAGKSGKSPTSAPAKSRKAAAAPADRPTLVDLVREHLAEQSEPRSAAEIATTLGRAHTDRGVKPTVVRTTLEALVAKGQAQRTRQGRSVFYTTPDAPEQQAGRAAQADRTDPTPAASESRSEDAA